MWRGLCGGAAGVAYDDERNAAVVEDNRHFNSLEPVMPLVPRLFARLPGELSGKQRHVLFSPHEIDRHVPMSSFFFLPLFPNHIRHSWMRLTLSFRRISCATLSCSALLPVISSVLTLTLSSLCQNH